ncbi:MAG: hypothetical protein LBP94_01245 [Zoogloeaceae bacterium]|nr:hypothetical protein [Zoogloeaceae bacterium]
MSTEREEPQEFLEPEFGCFEEEVLNAEWQRPELQLGQQPVMPHHDRFPTEGEIETFLKMVYLNQE